MERRMFGQRSKWKWKKREKVKHTSQVDYWLDAYVHDFPNVKSIFPFDLISV